MMKFPTEWKVIKFHGSKPPISNIYMLIGLQLMLKKAELGHDHPDPYTDIRKQMTSVSTPVIQSLHVSGRRQHVFQKECS